MFFFLSPPPFPFLHFRFQKDKKFSSKSLENGKHVAESTNANRYIKSVAHVIVSFEWFFVIYQELTSLVSETEVSYFPFFIAHFTGKLFFFVTLSIVYSCIFLLRRRLSNLHVQTVLSLPPSSCENFQFKGIRNGIEYSVGRASFSSLLAEAGSRERNFEIFRFFISG